MGHSEQRCGLRVPIAYAIGLPEPIPIAYAIGLPEPIPIAYTIGLPEPIPIAHAIGLPQDVRRLARITAAARSVSHPHDGSGTAATPAMEPAPAAEM